MKPAVFSGVMVVAFAGYFGYHTIYLRGQQRMSALRAQLTARQQAQVRQGDIARVVSEAAQLRKRLPPAPDTEWLLQEVGKIARQEGVQLASIAPQEPKRLQDATSLSVSLKFTSSYHQLGRFISALENASLFLWIETLDLSRSRMGTAQVDLTVSTAWVPSLTAAGEGDNRSDVVHTNGYAQR